MVLAAMKRAILTLAALTLAASVAGTPREAHADALPGIHAQAAAGPRLAEHVEPVAALPASGAGWHRDLLRVGGWATWCAPTPTRCQSWGGDAMVGAVQSFRFGDEPYLVRVHHGSRSVVVWVVSYCACGIREGKATVIDLSPAAFDDLAPLGAGLVLVEVEDLRGQAVDDPPPHPDDQRMRLEDRPLPATSTEETP